MPSSSYTVAKAHCEQKDVGHNIGVFSGRIYCQQCGLTIDEIRRDPDVVQPTGAERMRESALAIVKSYLNSITDKRAEVNELLNDICGDIRVASVE